MARAKIATSKRAAMRAALLAFSNQHREGLGLDGFPDRAVSPPHRRQAVADARGTKRRELHSLVVGQSRSIDACQYRALSGGQLFYAINGYGDVRCRIF
jgi:hypothetical protein